MLLPLGQQAAFAASGRPAFPRYDIAGFCHTDFGQGTLDRTMQGLCIRSERDARDNMRRRWSSIPADTLSRCLAAEAEARKRFGGAGSYEGIRNCTSEVQAGLTPAQTNTPAAAPNPR